MPNEAEVIKWLLSNWPSIIALIALRKVWIVVKIHVLDRLDKLESVASKNSRRLKILMKTHCEKYEKDWSKFIDDQQSPPPQNAAPEIPPEGVN